MTNPINKLIETILIDTNSEPNLKNELLNDLTEETKHYYDILNTRAEQGQPVEELELEMLTEKIYKDIRANRILITGKFDTSESAKPLDIVYGFDVKKLEQQVAKFKAMPGIEYVGTSLASAHDEFRY